MQSIDERSIRLSSETFEVVQVTRCRLVISGISARATPGAKGYVKSVLNRTVQLTENYVESDMHI